MQQLPLNAILQHFSQALNKSQNLPRPEIQRRQFTLIEKLCRHARAHVPFYRDTGRLDPLFDADGTFRFERWKEVPLLKRQDVVDNYDAMIAENLPPEMLPVTDDRTSGSTGIALKVKRTFMQMVASRALFDRAMAWNRCGPAEKLAIVDIPRLDSSGTRPNELAGESARRLMIPAHLDPDDQIAMIARFQPSHVIAFPNLAETWIRTGRLNDLRSIKAMFSIGEVLRADTRRILERELNIRLINLYSATEAGPIAIAGTDDRLRISEETLLLEQPDGAIDPSRPVQVVATPFYAYAMPLIRYAIGDYVRFSARRVRDAAGLRRLEGVLGRERNLFRRRDGIRIWPAINGDVIGDIIPLRGWQLVQETVEDLILKIVTPARPDMETIDHCVRAMTTMVPGFNIRIELVEQIEDARGSGKRFESCVSLVS